MQTRTLKLFVVGPHDEERYEAIRDYIKRVVLADPELSGAEIIVVTPDQNPTGDRFNDWIFGQIDTCDILVVDLTNFNPNVIYEVAFAHSLGVPCSYITFQEEILRTSGSLDNQLKHYFKFTLLPRATLDELRNGRNADFDRQLLSLIKGRAVSTETILSDYYAGMAPVDAEFVRGLAEGYYRNFLRHLLRSHPPSEHRGDPLYILIPDTFEKPDAEIRRSVSAALNPTTVTMKKTNSMDRPLAVGYAQKERQSFFFDVPTTLLTITRSAKYVKVDRADYFTEADRDRLTDRMARRFVAGLWDLIRRDRSSIEWPLDRFQIVWISDAIGAWGENSELMNSNPLVRPISM